MTDTADRAPRANARIAGVFYLLNIVFGVLALFVAGQLRSALLLGATGCYVVVTILFYRLFRPVNRDISMLAAAYSLIGCTLSILNTVHFGSFGLNSLVFFGCYCLLIGYLILRSTFLPGILGVLMAFSGIGWLTFISPALSGHLSPYNLAPGVIGETALTLWLLIMGVSTKRWSEQARAVEEVPLAAVTQRHVR